MRIVTVDFRQKEQRVIQNQEGSEGRMKITGFCPIIVSQDWEAAVKVFEDLGFEKIHTKSGIEGGANTNYNLKDENGNRINIASSTKIPRDLMAINMNVDNFDEAYDFLISRGFVNTRGDKVTDSGFKAMDGSSSLPPSSKSVLMVSPSGFAINLVEHIKKKS